MTLWRTYPGTRTPLPYAVQRPEQRLCLDLYAIWCGDGKPLGDEAHRARTWASAINYPFGGAVNWTNLALGVQASRGTNRLHRWHRHKYDCERLGHNLGEWCSIIYNDRTVLGRACAVAGLQDPDHPAAELLRRDLLLFAILARPIVARDGKGRVVYEGYGWRRAGLRSTANHWAGWLDSYLCASILGLPANVTARGKRQEREFVEMVEAVDRAREVLDDDLSVSDCWALVDSLDEAGAYAERLSGLAAPLRVPPGMSAILARDVQSGETFSCLLGTRIGSNTGATWAAYAKGPELGDVTWCYPWRDAKGQPIKRVRTGKLQRAGKVGMYPDQVLKDDNPTGEVFTLSVRSERGGLRDDITTPSWLYDDTRTIRLEVFHDKPAVLSLPGGGCC